MIKAVHILISGRVQGVGFRYFTKHTAENLNIKGYVKNLYNGDVEVKAQGDSGNIEIFIEKLKKGPRMSYVEHLKIDETDKFNPSLFEVRY